MSFVTKLPILSARPSEIAGAHATMLRARHMSAEDPNERDSRPAAETAEASAAPRHSSPRPTPPARPRLWRPIRALSWSNGRSRRAAKGRLRWSTRFSTALSSSAPGRRWSCPPATPRPSAPAPGGAPPPRNERCGRRREVPTPHLRPSAEAAGTARRVRARWSSAQPWGSFSAKSTTLLTARRGRGPRRPGPCPTAPRRTIPCRARCARRLRARRATGARGAARAEAPRMVSAASDSIRVRWEADFPRSCSAEDAECELQHGPERLWFAAWRSIAVTGGSLGGLATTRRGAPAQAPPSRLRGRRGESAARRVVRLPRARPVGPKRAVGRSAPAARRCAPWPPRAGGAFDLTRAERAISRPAPRRGRRRSGGGSSSAARVARRGARRGGGSGRASGAEPALAARSAAEAGRAAEARGDARRGRRGAASAAARGATRGGVGRGERLDGRGGRRRADSAPGEGSGLRGGVAKGAAGPHRAPRGRRRRGATQKRRRRRARTARRGVRRQRWRTASRSFARPAAWRRLRCARLRRSAASGRRRLEAAAAEDRAAAVEATARADRGAAGAARPAPPAHRGEASQATERAAMAEEDRCSQRAELRALRASLSRLLFAAATTRRASGTAAGAASPTVLRSQRRRSAPTASRWPLPPIARPPAARVRPESTPSPGAGASPRRFLGTPSVGPRAAGGRASPGERTSTRPQRLRPRRGARARGLAPNTRARLDAVLDSGARRGGRPLQRMADEAGRKQSEQLASALLPSADRAGASCRRPGAPFPPPRRRKRQTSVIYLRFRRAPRRRKRRKPRSVGPNRQKPSRTTFAPCRRGRPSSSTFGTTVRTALRVAGCGCGPAPR